VGAGWGEAGSNQPGVSPSAATSASRARPAAVACAPIAAASALPKFSEGLVMLTIWTEGSINCWNANSASRAVFQVATPPDSTPHMGSAALNRFG
jgi:hypothetical protein